MAKLQVPSPIPQQMSRHIRDYGWCRASAHRWMPNTNGLVVKAGVVTVNYKCENCDGERNDGIELSTGDLVSRRYEMPEGYVLQVKGTGEKRPKKSDWRKEHFRLLTRRR